MSAFRNRYWSFRLEQKVFVLHLLRDGGGINISERTRFRSFEMELCVTAAVWCLEVMQEVVLVEDKQEFVRKFRGPNFVLLAEKTFSRKGFFLRLTKLSNGLLKTIIVPEGTSRWGWRKLVDCLDNLVGKRFLSSHRGTRQGSFQGARMHKDVRTHFNSGTKNKVQIQGNRDDEGGKWDGDCVVDESKKGWRQAVLIVRACFNMQWRNIQLGLDKLFNFHLDITPFAADRAILWCVNDEQKRKLALAPSQRLVK